MKLNLLQSLNYTKIDGFDTINDIDIMKNGEFLICYEVNPKQGCNIEPEKELFLENMMFAGKKSVSSASPVTLPAGYYLFVQSRGDAPLNRDEWLDMAIEQQKDGLWERDKPENYLYIRFLFEDGKYVTQVFRPVAC
jgi:hypothetical protein